MKTHTRLEIRELEKHCGLTHVDWLRIDEYMSIPVLGDASKPRELFDNTPDIVIIEEKRPVGRPKKVN